jgi:hypothetical protein
LFVLLPLPGVPVLVLPSPPKEKELFPFWVLSGICPSPLERQWKEFSGNGSTCVFLWESQVPGPLIPHLWDGFLMQYLSHWAMVGQRSHFIQNALQDTWQTWDPQEMLAVT